MNTFESESASYGLLGILAFFLVLFWTVFPVVVCLQINRVQQLLTRLTNAVNDPVNGKNHLAVLAELKATTTGIEKLHGDMRLAYYDSTTCGDCGVGFEYPTRLSGKETICPHCGIPVKLPK